MKCTILNKDKIPNFQTMGFLKLDYDKEIWGNSNLKENPKQTRMMTLEGSPWAPFAQSSWASWVARPFFPKLLIWNSEVEVLLLGILFPFWFVFFFAFFFFFQQRLMVFQSFQHDWVSQSSYWTQECAWLRCWVLLRRRLPGRSTFWWPSQCPSNCHLYQNHKTRRCHLGWKKSTSEEYTWTPNIWPSNGCLQLPNLSPDMGSAQTSCNVSRSSSFMGERLTLPFVAAR